jgi:hypothetical protein
MAPSTPIGGASRARAVRLSMSYDQASPQGAHVRGRDPCQRAEALLRVCAAGDQPIPGLGVGADDAGSVDAQGGGRPAARDQESEEHHDA